MRQQPQSDVASLVEKFMNIMVEQNGEVKKMIIDLTQRVEELESKVNQGSSQLSAQIVVNPRNVSAITLRSGKRIREFEKAQENEDKENKFAPIDKSGGLGEPVPCTSEMPTPTNDSRLVSSNSSSSYSPLPPYPKRLKPKTKKLEELDQEILNTFKKVEINIPLLDAVSQIPQYVKFLKELCTTRRRVRDNEVVNLGRNVLSLIKGPIEIPQKCKDPGMFFVPFVIGSTKFDSAMLDLGASINVMPLQFLLLFIMDLLRLQVLSFNWPTVA